jgi:hypothetical protein
VPKGITAGSVNTLLHYKQNIKISFDNFFDAFFRVVPKGLIVPVMSTSQHGGDIPQPLARWVGLGLSTFSKSIFSRWRMEGLEFTSTSSIPHPKKIPRKKSKVQDGPNVCHYYWCVWGRKSCARASGGEA